MTKNLRLISMSDVQAEEVKWIWYPYIPRGKVTIIQGDPGEGKTTFMLEVISLLTRGEALADMCHGHLNNRDKIIIIGRWMISGYSFDVISKPKDHQLTN